MNIKRTTSELNRLSPADFKAAEKMPVRVVLDDIRSMANVGSFFRTGDAFRVGQLCLCGITAKPPHREIEKSALGATQSVDWMHHADIRPMLEDLKKQGIKIVVVEQASNAESPHQLQWNDAWAAEGAALVFGNEVNGVDAEVVAMADAVIEIPMEGTKHSLNVAVSAGIVLWECWKSWKAFQQKNQDS